MYIIALNLLIIKNQKLKLWVQEVAKNISKSKFFPEFLVLSFYPIAFKIH